MTSSLGHQNMLVGRGRNDHATETILKGEVVALDITAVVAADGLNNDVVFAIQPNTTNDDSTGLAARAIGIALHDIPAGAVGEFCMFGLVQCLGDDTAAVGSVINPADADGRTSDAASANDGAPCGIQLETGVQGSLKWCFVDFISGSFGGSMGAGTVQTLFWGTAY